MGRNCCSEEEQRGCDADDGMLPLRWPMVVLTLSTEVKRLESCCSPPPPVATCRGKEASGGARAAPEMEAERLRERVIDFSLFFLDSDGISFLRSFSSKAIKKRGEANLRSFPPSSSPRGPDTKRRTCSSPPYPLNEHLERFHGLSSDPARCARLRARGEAEEGERVEQEHSRDDDELNIAPRCSSCRLQQERLKLDRRPERGAPERRGVSSGRARKGKGVEGSE